MLLSMGALIKVTTRVSFANFPNRWYISAFKYTRARRVISWQFENSRIETEFFPIKKLMVENNKNLYTDSWKYCNLNFFFNHKFGGWCGDKLFNFLTSPTNFRSALVRIIINPTRSRENQLSPAYTADDGTRLRDCSELPGSDIIVICLRRGKVTLCV